MVKLERVREFGSAGKVFYFRVNHNRLITIDTEADNSIKWVWFHECDDIVSSFNAEGLVYVENLTSGIYLDLDKIREYDHMFIEHVNMFIEHVNMSSYSDELAF